MGTRRRPGLGGEKHEAPENLPAAEERWLVVDEDLIGAEASRQPVALHLAPPF